MLSIWPRPLRPRPRSQRSAVIAGTVLTAALSITLTAAPAGANTADDYVGLVTGTADEKVAAWHRVVDAFAVDQLPMLLDVLHVSPSRQLRVMAVELMEQTTGQSLGTELDAWYHWLWNQESRSDHPQLAEFKSKLWRHIDPKFAGYFANDRDATIRLDEVRWGGVVQDGIPPLRDPKLVGAKAARYLDDRNLVFGVVVNGEAHAYPKRILAWHEMVTETIGGVPVAGVYCTLCGTMILYETKVDDTNYDFGTSGFLYRSNKLMFDQGTQSLWNTFWGRAVIGPLVGKVELPRHSVVTTTWGAWKSRHPDTRVLALNTGYERDYSEGAAYRQYFATDDLMFTVQHDDQRLLNKAEVLALVLRGGSAESEGPDTEKALAISADFLTKNRVYLDELAGVELVVLTDDSGANRVYRRSGITFTTWDGQQQAVDDRGSSWRVEEEALVGPDDQRLERLPAQRAFWFGWRASYPETRLVK